MNNAREPKTKKTFVKVARVKYQGRRAENHRANMPTKRYNPQVNLALCDISTGVKGPKVWAPKFEIKTHMDGITRFWAYGKQVDEAMYHILQFNEFINNVALHFPVLAQVHATVNGD